MAEELHFLDFRIDSDLQKVFRKNKVVPIKQSAYRLLRYLISHQGKTVTRDELIEHLWRGRFVQDATLYKQIQRLRKLLGDTDENKQIIKTVHGIGFIFIPPVETFITTDDHPKQSDNSKLSHKYRLLTAVLLLAGLMVLALVWMRSTTDSQSLESSVKTQRKPVLVSVIPDISSTADQDNWMALGGMHYLYVQLGQAEHVKFKRLSKKELDQQDSQTVAIELTNQQHVDAAIILNMHSQEGQFQASVSIRNFDGIIEQTNFTTHSLYALLEEVQSWIATVLDLPTDSTNTVMSRNSFAVENYIRGMAAQFSGDAAEALNYLELATKEDRGFWKAWYELAIAYRKQGNTDKALSIFKTLESTAEASSLFLSVQNALIITHWRIGSFNEGLAVADRAIAVAKAENNPSMLATLTTNKAYIAQAMNNWDLAETLVNQSIDILNRHPNAGSKASNHNFLSSILMHKNRLEDAKQELEKAITLYKQSGDQRYVALNKSRLASILIRQGELQKAENILQQNLLFHQSQNDRVSQILSHHKLVDLNLIQTNINAANEHLNQAETLLELTTNKSLSQDQLILSIQKSLIDQQMTQASYFFQQLNTLNGVQTAVYFDVAMAYYLQSDQIQLSQSTLKLWQQSEHQQAAQIRFWQAKLAVASNDKVTALQAYEESMDLILKQHDLPKLWLIGASYLEFLLVQDDTHRAPELIQIIELTNPPAYPFLKLKAKWAASQSDYFLAAALLQEFKSKKIDLWNTEDQLLLETYQQALEKPKKKPVNINNINQ